MSRPGFKYSVCSFIYVRLVVCLGLKVPIFQVPYGYLSLISCCDGRKALLVSKTFPEGLSKTLMKELAH